MGAITGNAELPNLCKGGIDATGVVGQVGIEQLSDGQINSFVEWQLFGINFKVNRVRTGGGFFVSALLGPEVQ